MPTAKTERPQTTKNIWSAEQAITESFFLRVGVSHSEAEKLRQWDRALFRPSVLFPAPLINTVSGISEMVYSASPVLHPVIRAIQYLVRRTLACFDIAHPILLRKARLGCGGSCQYFDVSFTEEQFQALKTFTRCATLNSSALALAAALLVRIGLNNWTPSELGVRRDYGHFIMNGVFDSWLSYYKFWARYKFRSPSEPLRA
jgi:hypothetical protein